MQVLVPNDAEQAVIDHLNPHSPGIIGTGVPPSPLPPQFVRVVQVGGAQRDLVTDSPTLSLEVFDRDSESDARELAELFLGIIQSAPLSGFLGSVPCYRVQVVALPQNYPMPSVPTHFRYIMTIAPDLRRRVLTL